MKKLTSMFSTAGAFVGATVMSSAAFAVTDEEKKTVINEYLSKTKLKADDLVNVAELDVAQDAAVMVITALVSVGILLLAGRAIMRALQLRP